MKAVGYAALIARYQLACAQPQHTSCITDRAGRERHVVGISEQEQFPRSYDPGDGDVEQLVFALKYDGVELAVLKATFQAIERDALAVALRDKPTSKYLRRLWFLYEWLTDARLDVPDLDRGNYVELLDPRRYFTGVRRDSQRHRVRVNLLGSRCWCPLVRRTARLQAFVDRALDERARQIISEVDPHLLARAVAFLYTKETRSSYLIEREEIGESRVERFVGQLRRLSSLETLREETLVELQNAIVESRYAERGYRTEQNYVGESLPTRERVHYVPPRPEDVGEMMAALLETGARLSRERRVDPVIAAACMSFGFVYIHPFLDGNGRLHRLLIHHVLARMGFIPRDVLVPISAAIVRDPGGYDAALEAFSLRVMPRVTYKLDPRDGALTVENDTADLYRFPDLTAQAEALYQWVATALEQDLLQEFDIIERFDAAREAMREVIEMPDRKEQLFLNICFRNRPGCHIPRRKRTRHFPELSDDEIAQLEAAIRGVFTADSRVPP